MYAYAHIGTSSLFSSILHIYAYIYTNIFNFMYVCMCMHAWKQNRNENSCTSSKWKLVINAAKTTKKTQIPLINILHINDNKK